MCDPATLSSIQADISYLDVAKAFDTVPHKILNSNSNRLVFEVKSSTGMSTSSLDSDKVILRNGELSWQ